MRFGVLASFLLHACAIGLAFISLPDFLRTKVVEATVIPVELIREAELAEKTSVPAAAPKPKPKAEEPPDLPKPKEEEPKPTPKAESEPAPKPEPKAEEPAPKPELPKPKPQEKPKPKPKQEDLDLDALSALVDKSRKSDAASDADSNATLEAERARPAIGAGDRLAASEIDKMRAAVSRCWNASAIIGAPEPEKLIVELDIDLNRDGTLSGAPRVVNALQINLSGNRFWKVAEQNAIRAVQACQPYDFFDPMRYQEWKAFTLNFDPSIMAGF
ncbi:MAG: hypothetical protein KDE05_04700 [Parvularculaceae bacterium]|nr:hypothetical protein [Parvularculaceae bacterium]